MRSVLEKAVVDNRLFIYQAPLMAEAKDLNMLERLTGRDLGVRSGIMSRCLRESDRG